MLSYQKRFHAGGEKILLFCSDDTREGSLALALGCNLDVYVNNVREEN
jgi:hypothetical protein